MLKPIFAFLGGLVLALLIMDYATYNAVRLRMSDAEDHALDAALVMGLVDMDAGRGQLFLDEDRGRDYSRDVFRKDMNLNASYENEFLSGTTLNVIFTTSSGRPFVKARCTAKINMLLPRLLAMQPIIVDVSKSRYFLESYR